MQSYIRDIEHFSMYLESIALNEPTAVSAEDLQRYMESLNSWEEAPLLLQEILPLSAVFINI